MLTPQTTGCLSCCCCCLQDRSQAGTMHTTPPCIVGSTQPHAAALPPPPFSLSGTLTRYSCSSGPLSCLLSPWPSSSATSFSCLATSENSVCTSARQYSAPKMPAGQHTPTQHTARQDRTVSTLHTRLQQFPTARDKARQSAHSTPGCNSSPQQETRHVSQHTPRQADNPVPLQGCPTAAGQRSALLPHGMPHQAAKHTAL
jgi:hypothetical protein